MWLKRKNKEQAASAKHDWLAQRIAGAIISRQQKLSNSISGLIASMPVQWLKWSLMAFCLVGSGGSVYFFTTAFKSCDKELSPIRIDYLQRPAHLYNSTDGLLQQTAIREKEYDKLQDIKSYLDSLRRDQGGKSLYDSIMDARPGLPDSIKLLEVIYLQQHKK
jgi:hypothetical protein